MVSTSRKKALKSVSICQNKVTFKNWIPPIISINRKIRLFFKNLILSNFNNGFHQQKQKLENSFLSKQYSFIQSFLLVETIIETQKPIFKEKLLCSQQKLFFWLVKNSFFHLSDILTCENSFSVKWKCIFKRILHSGQWKRIFCLVERVFFFNSELCRNF